MSTPSESEPYAARPCYPELILALLTGVGHVVLELLADGLHGAAESMGRPQHIYNGAAAILWAGYLLWRAVRSTGALQAWGFRRQGFRDAMRAGAIFSVLAVIPLLAFGWFMGRFPLPVGFWLLLGIYPLYGIAQQFLLQALITRNLRTRIPHRLARAFVAAALFSLVHFPNWQLMPLTFVAGLGFTWIYEKHRNIWAVGIFHGILGAVAYTCVLGLNPGGELLQWMR